MLKPISNRAKINLNSFTGSLWAILTPKGAVNTLAQVISKTAGQ